MTNDLARKGQSRYSIQKLKIAKMSVGAVIAYAAASALELDFAVSAGIITLLTICDTKRETVKVTVKRFIAFVFVTLLCRLFFEICGYNAAGLLFVLMVFLIICALFDMNEAVAMNCVIATHYLSTGDVSLRFAGNELLLLITGAGTGVLLNLIMPENIRKIRSIQNSTDSKMSDILHRMSVYILAEDRSEYTGSCFVNLDTLLSELRSESLSYIGNSFSGGRDYFLRYVDMRITQCGILKRIYSDITALGAIPIQAKPIADYLKRMSEEFHELNDAASLLLGAEELFEHYASEALPQSRDEFESRALLYHILCDLKAFVNIKAEFAKTITEKEKQKYWTS